MRFLFLFLLVFILYGLFGESTDITELQPSWRHPLGTDEFGRDNLTSLFKASGITVITALLLTTIILAISYVLVFLFIVIFTNKAELFFRSLLLVIESCPIVLWIFVIISVLNWAPRFISVLIAFSIAMVPIVSSVLFAEYMRLSNSGFAQSSRCVGVNERKILLDYVLPNSFPIVVPVIVNVLGAAIAVDGALSLIGMGNRSKLDIGVMIVRAKERLLIDPWLALGVSIALFMIYIFLYQLQGLVLNNQEKTNRKTLV